MTDFTQRILIIYNPNSGPNNKNLFQNVLHILKASGSLIDIIETKYPGHAEEISKNINPKQYDKICVAGGDGTINEILNGLYPCPLALGIIPLGTANVLAKELMQSETAENIADVLLNGTPLDCWLGKIGDRYFSLMVSMGPDADTVGGVSVPLKKYIGKMAYAVSFIKKIIFYRPIIYEATIDGKIYQAAAVIISKGKYYGGKFICAPKADLTKKEFHIVLFEKSGRIATCSYALKMFLNKIPIDKTVTTIIGKNISVTSNYPALTQIDGDLGNILPVSVTLSDTTLSIMSQTKAVNI